MLVEDSILIDFDVLIWLSSGILLMVSGNAIPWSKDLYVIILVSMMCLKLWNYRYCRSRRQREAKEGGGETTGCNRGLRTDFGLVRESRPLPTPPGNPELDATKNKTA